MEKYRWFNTSSAYILELALFALSVPVKCGHIDESVQATHATLYVQSRVVLGLDMGSKAPVMLVLLGTDTAVELSVLTEGVEDLAGGRVLVPRSRPTGLAAPHSGRPSLGCPTGV